MSALHELAELVREQSGIALKPAQHASLAAAVARAAPGHDVDAVLEAARRPAGGPDLLARIVEEVAVKETFFFRHEPELAAVPWHGLLQAARAAGREAVRVWSAACATGEEAYTLAILASEAFGGATPPVAILATDLSPTALAHAARGEYGRRALSNAALHRRERWFRPSGRHLLVAP